MMFLLSRGLGAIPNQACYASDADWPRLHLGNLHEIKRIILRGFFMMMTGLIIIFRLFVLSR